ncbi:ROK family protein [Nocardia sp. NPDC051787]|uniref:ROK family protein n=1 Tax=Nocardia sp. NPDC051787 TaxID=3155415 RepID=UPI00342B5498
MTVLALEIGAAGFAASRVAAGIGTLDIQRIPVPADGVWDACRDLLLDVAGDDEITAVGIACPSPIDKSAGVVAPAGITQWRAGFGIVAAVRRLFPVAIVRMASDGLCLTLAERSIGSAAGAEAILTGAGILALIAEERAIRGTPLGHGDERAHRHLRTRDDYRPAQRMVCVRRRPR